MENETTPCKKKELMKSNPQYVLAASHDILGLKNLKYFQSQI